MPESNYSNEQLFPFEELLRSTSIVFYHCDLSDGFPLLFISPNVEDILGFTKEEFEANPQLWINRIHPEDRNKVLTTYNSIADREKRTIEFRFRHADGYYLWLRDEVKLITDEQDNAHSLVGTSIEITDRKTTEAELKKLNKSLEKLIKERTSKLASTNRTLKEQNQKLKLQKLALDNLNDLVIITRVPKDDPLDSKIIFVNKAFEHFTGYQSGEVLGKSPTFLHGPQTSDKVLKTIERKIKNHEHLRAEMINYKKDGTNYWAELDMSPFPTEDENYEYWVGINRDITDRKRAEQQLEESEQRYRAFAELSFDAIFEIDLNGTIINCNKKASQLFGYSRAELIGMDTRELTPDQFRDMQPDIISDTVTTGDEALERTYLKKDGTLLPTEIHTQMYRLGDKKRLIAYVRDNSAHKTYENTIHRSLKEKETLLAEVHHRVKNNLAIISGLLEMQAFNTDEDQLLDKLRESQSRIQSIAMVHEKLYQSESFSEIDIDRYIDDLLSMIINSMINTDNSIKVTRDMDSVAMNIAQAIPCGLLLNELITNCYKHAFGDREEGAIHISLKQKDHHIRLRVSDNGRGLPDDFNIDQVTSLGMTLINTLVTQLNGELEIHNEGGTAFIIRFELEN